jgi:UDP-GlcNAc:undecaprenyl-phosphate GlcNAc-1-phosphate transferase
VSLRHFAAILVFAGVVTLLVTPLVRSFSERHGFVDRPGGRKVHKEPISRLGGFAIFIGVAAAVAAQILGEKYLGWGGSFISQTGGRFNIYGLYGGLTLMFLVGLLDDLFDIAPSAKLLGQIAAGVVVALSGLRIEFVGRPLGGGIFLLGLLSIPVTVVYLVGFANVINLIDGLDGLAAGVSAIAAASLLLIAIQGNRLDAAALAAALIGACLGFLRYNFHPASIFMGDSGAMFIGFALAAISLLGVMKTTATIALAVPLIIIGVPIFDTASAIVRRLRHKRPIQEADKGHIHHKLLGRGFDQRQTVLIIYVWSAALAVGGWAVRYSPSLVKIVALATLLSATAFMAYWLGLYDAAHHASDGED